MCVYTNTTCASHQEGECVSTPIQHVPSIRRESVCLHQYNMCPPSGGRVCVYTNTTCQEGECVSKPIQHVPSIRRESVCLHQYNMCPPSGGRVCVYTNTKEWLLLMRLKATTCKIIRKNHAARKFSLIPMKSGLTTMMMYFNTYLHYISDSRTKSWKLNLRRGNLIGAIGVPLNQYSTTTQTHKL